MGYRSDVSIAFYTLDAERMPFAALKLWFDENYPHEVAKAEWAAKIDEGDNYLLVDYTRVKWRDGADHVTAVHKAFGRFTETFDTEDAGKQGGAPAAYDFVRIGEEENDIDTDYSAWSSFRLDVRREIVFA